MPLEKFDLTGKTALITGGAGLLGIEHAAALLECGAKVVLTDVRAIALNTVCAQLSQMYEAANILTQQMDVSKPEDIRRVADGLWSAGLRIDILINNAAIDPKVNSENKILEVSRLENFSVSQWNAQVAVGLTGAFLCSQIFGTAMAEDGGGGVILNIASDLSVISPDQRGFAEYNAAGKARDLLCHKGGHYRTDALPSNILG
jgi:NAD(P)-dependent dehydrogenase (short-subunit alcohol dehydrogenase family)